VCHSIAARDLGAEVTFSGQPRFDTERHLFGPYADVATGPMLAQVRYTPMHGPHVQRSALCGSCHTLTTEHEGTPFLEQSPYLEWRNSEFSDEDGVTATSRSCQQCHMARTGATRIARNPMGLDFAIPVREGYAAHAFVGGNAFVLDLLQEHREELDVLAEPDALLRMAAATRRQLAEDTARLTIAPIARDQGNATFAVRVENLTGHKFPTGYPARRAWLHVELYDGQRLLFESGGFDDQGHLVDVAKEHGLPHVQTVTQPGDVVVYELVATDPDGAPTTHLTRMVGKQKDSRLLPRGWRADGPHAADIAPVGTDGDADFGAGGDTVAFRIALPERVRGRLRVQAELRYQSVPPHWVDALRTVADDAAQRFVQMYDAAEKVPEVVATAFRRER
jgi:hypothetical protein